MPGEGTSTIGYTLFSDDSHYVFNIVCYFDTKKAKVKFDPEINAIRVMGPAPSKGMDKINGYVYLPKNCEGSEAAMEVDNKKGLKIRLPKKAATAHRVPTHLSVSTDVAVTG